MKWWNIIKEAGGQSFGSHGANPLMSAESPAIRSKEDEEDAED